MMRQADGRQVAIDLVLRALREAANAEKAQPERQGQREVGKAHNDDLDVINGRRDQLEGKIQERYGIDRDQVRKGRR